MLRFAGPDLPGIVCLEQLTGTLSLDKPQVADNYPLALERVCVLAATPAGSVGVLSAALAGAWPTGIPGRFAAGHIGNDGQ